MPNPKILIVDDHPLFRDALKAALNAASEAFQFEEAENLDVLTQKLEANADIDLVLLDLKMPGVQGLSGLVFLRAQYPAVPVVIVSGHDDVEIMGRVFRLGASGFIPKSTSAENMRAAVKLVLSGSTWFSVEAKEVEIKNPALENLAKRMATLTPQQMRVLMMVREGLLNKQIAFKLGVSEATVKAHVSAILLKLDVDSRTQAVIAASRLDGEAET